MHFLTYGWDYFANAPLGQKLAWELGIALLFLVVAFIGFHLFRRSFGPPVHTREGELPPPATSTMQRYEVGARLYHWGNFAVMALLFWSGAAFFWPGLVFPLQYFIGVSWLLLHVILAWMFVGFVLMHILFAVFETGLAQMWFARGDGRDLTQRARYYSGGRNALPKHAKFDVFQKVYHWLLALFALVMIGTGISLFLSSEVVATLDANWMRWNVIFHDIFAFLFAAVIIGHIYLRLIRPRWPALRSMFTGNLTRGEFARAHDWRRWQPEDRTPSGPLAQTGNAQPQAGNEEGYHG